MAANQDDIRRWLADGKKRGATHVVVLCDTFGYDDYPLFIMPGEDAWKQTEKAKANSMAKVMECYSLSLDLEAQLAEHRAHHWE